MAKQPEKFIPEKFIKEKEFHKEIMKDKLEKEHKEHKEHKEKPEIKEKIEIKEIKEVIKEVSKDKPEKEHKDKPEKEIKEIKEGKEKELAKEVKEIEKPVKEKDKDAEGPLGGGDPVIQQAAHFKFKDISDKVHKEKDHDKIHVDKVQKDKDHDFAAAAAQPQAAQAQAKFTDKVIEKIHKDFDKTHKDKDFKVEKFEKHEIKEWKDIKEWDVAGPGTIDPGGPVEQRVAALESALTQLLHFIPQELRPDLSTGALSAEKRAQGGTAAKKSKRAAAKKATSEKK